MLFLECLISCVTTMQCESDLFFLHVLLILELEHILANLIRHEIENALFFIITDKQSLWSGTNDSEWDIWIGCVWYEISASDIGWYHGDILVKNKWASGMALESDHISWDEVVHVLFPPGHDACFVICFGIGFSLIVLHWWWCVRVISTGLWFGSGWFSTRRSFSDLLILLDGLLYGEANTENGEESLGTGIEESHFCDVEVWMYIKIRVC